MADIEEIRKKNLEESNEALAESLSLTAKLTDQMQFLYKNSKEKYTQDKLSVDLTKQAVALTKNLSAEYTSLGGVQKDIAKNSKLQNDILIQQKTLESSIGDKGMQRLQFIKNQEKGLSNSNELLKGLREKEAAGVKGAKEQADTLARQIISRRQSLATQIENLTAEERQYQITEETAKALEKNLE